MAKRHKNFRSGDINEDLGLLLLKSISFVAPVPRTEDVGVDAVCTLHRQEGNLLFAEDSFWIQLKSYDSTTKANNKITYDAEKCEWLKTLRLPFIIGFVDKLDLKIELFPTCDLNSQLMSSPSKATLKIGSNNSSPFSCSDDMDREVESTVCPIVSWSLQDVYKKDFDYMHRFYTNLKEYIRLESINIETRHSLGNDKKIDYQTNQLPVFGDQGNHEFLSNSYDVFSKIDPLIRRAISVSEIKEDRELLEKFLALASYLESHGVQIDGVRNLEKTIAEWDGAASISRLSIQETMELFQKGEV
jgi:hypothetical protein